MGSSLNPMQQWQAVATSLPDIPDTAYDAVREKFFRDTVTPWAYQNKYNLSTSRQAFMELSERAGKSAAPRLEVLAKSAVNEAVQPVLGAVGAVEAQDKLNRWVESSKLEAERQGYSTTIPEMAGKGLGMTPYLLPIMRGAKLAGMALELPEAVSAAGGLGMTSGVMEAAKAEDGQRLISGLKAGAEGAAVGLAFEGALSFLRSPSAKSVEKVIQGVGTPAEEQQAQAAVMLRPDLPEKLVKLKAAEADAAARAGVPRTPPTVQGSKKSIATVTAKDGKKVQIPTAKLTEALKQGQTLEEIAGSAREIHQTLKEVEKTPQAAEVFKLPHPQDDLAAEPKPRPGEEVSSSPSTSPGFSDWSTDHFEKMLQEKVMDPSVPPSAREAALKRLTSLNPKAAESTNSFRQLYGDASPRVDLTEEKPKITNLEAIIRKSASAKGEVNINSLGVRGQLDSTIAEQTLNEAISQGLIEPSRLIGRAGEEVQNYRIKAKGIEVKDIPDYDYLKRQTDGSFVDLRNGTTYNSLNEALGGRFTASGPERVDALLNEMKKRIRERYPEAKFESDRPPAPASSTPEPPSELETQLRASLARLKFPGIKYGAVSQDPDLEAFARLPKEEFLKMAHEIDPSYPAAELDQLYTWNIKRWNTGEEGKWVDRPMFSRVTAPGALAEGAEAATYPGQPPSIVYGKPTGVPRSTIWHETTHVLLDGAGMRPVIDRTFSGDFSQKLFNGAFGASADFYYRNAPDSINEEVFTWLSQAYRANDRGLIRSFAEADGGEDELGQWYVDRVRDVLDSLGSAPDSLYKRRLDTRLRDLINRSSGSLEDMSALTSAIGDEIEFTDGQFILRQLNGSVQRFDTREELADFLGENYLTPLNAPELVSFEGLPDGTPTFSSGRPPRRGAPIHTNPFPPEYLPKKDIKPGAATLSFFTRPFYNWVDTISEKYAWPELSERMHTIQDAEVSMRNSSREYLTVLRDTLGKISPNRQSNMFALLSAPLEKRLETADALGITSEERKIFEEFNMRFVTPLEENFGLSLETWARKWKGTASFDLDSLRPQAAGARGMETPLKFLDDGIRTGDLDPRDNNLLRVSSEYLRLGMRKQHLETPLVEAAKLINATDSAGNYVAANLQPLLMRHLSYLRGVPDFSTRMVYEGVQTTVGMINETLAKINEKLPESWQLDPIDLTPREALSKWITWQYAGALMLRPMVPLRDTLQYFVTTYPILGGKYTIRGIEKTFSKELGDAVHEIPRRYGALLEERDLLAFETGDEQTTANKFISWGMKYLQNSNNINRTAAFWGHSERILDTLKSLGDRPVGARGTFARDAGLIYLPKPRLQSYLDELLTLTPDKYQDFAYRASNELVDVSQWNYKRGAAPGFYKYGLGKLFGQYGTWPLNYIEWMRTVGSSGEAADKVAVGARILAAHTAILKAGESLGIDTGGWVFTQPMAYGGGPLFSAVTHLPQTADFETERGAEARREVVKPIWPMAIPGGLATQNIYKAIRDEDPDFWKIVLGFTPLDQSEYHKGLHALIPTSEENYRK